MQDFLNEIQKLYQKIQKLENSHLYPDISTLNYEWKTYKFTNIIPINKTTNQIQINIQHTGFKINLSEIDSANHKILLKVVDPNKKAHWETPWMDACNATSPYTMFQVDGTRCVYGTFSNTETRVCFIGHDTTHEAIFYVRIGIPLNSNIFCHNISLEQCNKIKFKNKNI